MPFWRIYYHIIWATKDRAPLLTPEVESRLYPYLFSKSSEMGGYVYEANGWIDHVHLVTSLPPKHAVAEFVKRLKGASSFDLNHVHPLAKVFSWQRGYGVLTLGESQLERALAYVRNQKVHHEQHSTNSWLERADEFDDGPPQRLVSGDRIREETAPYAPSEGERFP